MTQDELLWTIGRNVRTEDDTMFNCGESKAEESEAHKEWHRDGLCSQDDCFGGEGLVEQVYVDEKEQVWLLFDWGYAIQVKSTTRVLEVQRGNG